MNRWRGLVALVTGASSGIGAELCRELVKHDMKVVGCARRVEKIVDISNEKEVVEASGSLHAIKCDLRNESEILQMFGEIKEKYGRIDVCINSAGVNIISPITTGMTSEWQAMLDINVLALCICTRESIKLMREKNIENGQIININSIAGHQIDSTDFGFYGGTKNMVRILNESLRRELRSARSSIRVASISPGLVRTEMLGKVYKDDAEKVKAIYEYFGNNPLEVKDISAAVRYILESPPHVEVNDIIVRPTQQPN